MNHQELIKRLILLDTNIYELELSQNNFDELIALLRVFVQDMINPGKKEEKKRLYKITNFIIDLFYNFIHNEKIDCSAIHESLCLVIKDIDKTIKESIAKNKSKISKLKNIDHESAYSHVLSRMRNLNGLLIKYLEENRYDMELDFLWFLMTEIKNYHLVDRLIRKNPTLLKINKDEGTILEKFIHFYADNYKTVNQNYLKQILFLLLEAKYLNIGKEEYFRINNYLHTLEDMEETNYLKEIIASYYECDEELVRKNIMFHMENNKADIRYKKPWQVGCCHDFRHHKTISIDSVVASKDHCINYDDAFTLFTKDNHFMVYVHYPDVPGFIHPKTDLESDLQHRIFALRNFCQYNPLIADWFAHQHLSLLPNIDRFAITIGIEVDNYGHILDVHFLESIIRNKKSFSTEEVNKILSGEDKNRYQYLLNRYLELCDVLHFPTKNDITATLSLLAGKVVGEYFAHHHLPCIYRNCIPISTTLSPDEEMAVMNYNKNNLFPNYLDQFVKDQLQSLRTFFSHINYGHHALSFKAYAELSGPIRNYVAIKILQGIKEMVIKGAQDDEDTLQEFYETYKTLALKANAINSGYKF